MTIQTILVPVDLSRHAPAPHMAEHVPREDRDLGVLAGAGMPVPAAH